MNNYHNLELDIVQKKVAGLATFAMAKDFITNERVDYNPLVIKRNIKLTAEALEYLKNNQRFGFADITDIRPLLKNLDIDLTLTAKEISLILDHNIQIKRISKALGESFIDAEINDFIVSLQYDQSLIDTIQRFIDQNGEIRFDATEKLKVLNNKLTALETDISIRAQQFLRDNSNSLQEAVIYQREGRVCFLIKNNDKNKYDGLSHGLSASGLAAYVEPKTFVDLNNKLSEIKSDILKEKQRILQLLSMECQKDSDIFMSNLESLMYLDAVFAKASFGSENFGVMATIGDNLILNNIAHPLIDNTSVIKNSYHIIDPIHGIVITGSNTGGKTVSLKVIALSVLMTYLGIPLIADSASIPLYDHVLADIDDGQSIVDSLSTFSARLVSLKKILHTMTDRSLVLIDEIASGTDPKEGEALALAIIDRLESVHTTFVITTHFSKIKEFSLDKKDILLASQQFDTEKMVPTYRYLENTFGNSNALEIALKYLNDETLIQKAQDFLKLNQSEEERLLKELEIKQEQVAKREAELNKRVQDFEEKKARLQESITQFELQKDELFKKAKIKADNYLERQKEKIRKIIAASSAQGSKKKDVLKELDDLQKEFVQLPEKKEFKVGDGVKILSTSQVGKITDIKKDAVSVDVHGVIIKTVIANLESSELPKTVKKQHKDRSFKRVSSELLLVGMRTNEAIETLSKYLDEAYGSGMSQVKIIHGTGTGALKEAVWTYLKKQKFIKDFHYGDAYDGGSNVTIVELK